MIDYLPLYLQKYLEIKQIMTAEQGEIYDAWENLHKVWKNQFLSESTVEGVMRWETALGIMPKATDTLQERKFRILALWNQERPYTMMKLREVLDTLCGADGYSIELDENNYSITIKLALSNVANYDEVEKLLVKMIPANMTVVIVIKYNTHSVLAEFTHSQLSAYTHEELRSEVSS